MSDIKSHDSITELHESIDDMNDLMTAYKKQQQEMDMERAEFFERLQGSVAQHEKMVHEYEEKRKELDTRQAKLVEDKQACQENLDILQHQLDAKLGVPLQDQKGNKQSQAEIAKKTNDSSKQEETSPGITTQEQIDKLEAQRDKPKLEHNMDPPGMSQSSKIDQDLNKLIEEKKNKMSDASDNLKANWNAAKGRKH